MLDIKMTKDDGLWTHTEEWFIKELTKAFQAALDRKDYLSLHIFAGYGGHEYTFIPPNNGRSGRVIIHSSIVDSFPLPNIEENESPEDRTRKEIMKHLHVGDETSAPLEGILLANSISYIIEQENLHKEKRNKVKELLATGNVREDIVYEVVCHDIRYKIAVMSVLHVGHYYIDSGIKPDLFKASTKKELVKILLELLTEFEADAIKICGGIDIESYNKITETIKLLFNED